MELSDRYAVRCRTYPTRSTSYVWQRSDL